VAILGPRATREPAGETPVRFFRKAEKAFRFSGAIADSRYFSVFLRRVGHKSANVASGELFA
jgi:hypothetical protein